MLSVDPFDHHPPDGECTSTTPHEYAGQVQFPPSRAWPSPPYSDLSVGAYPVQQFYEDASPPQPQQPPIPAKQGRAGCGSKPSILVRRRRVSRACDRCNQLRTKCDGRQPCAHCIDFKLDCEYIREKKKRGKASRKDLAERAAAAAAAAAAVATDHRRESCKPQTLSVDGSEGGSWATSLPSDDSEDGSDRPAATPGRRHILQTLAPVPDVIPQQLQVVDVSQQGDVSGYGGIPVDCCEHGLPLDVAAGGMPTSSPQGYADPGFGLGPVPQSHDGFKAGPAFAVRSSPLDPYPVAAMASPGWGMHMSSTSLSPSPGHVPTPAPYTHLRYPVLGPLVSHLESALLPVSLACDLLDCYFSSTAQLHPLSPYVLGFVFRRKSFLHTIRPRRCQPALLASMLWVAAQTSDAALLTSSPAARGMVCQRLLDLTLRLLKPLVHASLHQTCPSSDASLAAHSLGDGFGVAMAGSEGMDMPTAECATLGAAGQLDDVATYMHIATVASASEYKGASLRWWNAAWSLARELKLGREVPPDVRIKDEFDASHPNDLCRNAPYLAAEEEREERRRLWWLLYIVDRHLALCFDRPLSILDIECDGLLIPMDDTAWQMGNFPAHQETGIQGLGGPASRFGALEAWRGESRFECRGHGIFGFFLPLMAILGEVVDLHHAQNHPSCGRDMRASGDWESRAEEIRRHVELYEQSLTRLEERCRWGSIQVDSGSESRLGEASSRGSSPSTQPACGNHRTTHDEVQTRTIVAYGTHATHVLHILLAGRWDAVGDNNTWTSSAAFFKAASHAISAADAVGRILEFDPGLELMPFFFGIYLMQGSLLLPLIAEELQLEASSSLVRACETILRAQEACIVTLSVERQRNFNRVMRSALAVARGREVDGSQEQRQLWREDMGPCRWTGNGTWLAL
ncbi:hypothetical protein XA68_17973 [Ophiocordyceps unilateralis]|uniref:Zn(2)-C6 fungal-type domain-containing protein n=1 Tax=Ophiocordyceps unilateralis TaxID=268505 RepID=A0A2A9PIP8_OPHUN|nr:hypothetical protein XA68_17973 [Ophiocordyceps unilateralis]